MSTHCYSTVCGGLTCTAVRLLPFLPSAPVNAILTSAVLGGHTSNVLQAIFLCVHACNPGHVQSHSAKLLLSDLRFVFLGGLSLSLSLYFKRSKASRPQGY